MLQKFFRIARSHAWVNVQLAESLVFSGEMQNLASLAINAAMIGSKVVCAYNVLRQLIDYRRSEK